MIMFESWIQKQGEKIVADERPLVALGMHKKDGHWYVVRIAYNPLTNEVGKLETVSEGDIKDVALERFRIMTSKEIF